VAELGNDWRTIWANRTLDPSEDISLETLIRLDGFDSGAGRILTKDWRVGVERFADLAGMRHGDSVFEFGCGSGAFLYALAEKFSIVCGGVDYSAPLIEVARKALPGANFLCTEASNVKRTPVYDHCISHGVFHYFDFTYAEKILDLMAAKAKRTVAVLEVPDAALKREAEDIRREALSEAEYIKKYAGLEHYYYEKDWFLEQATRLEYSCEFIDDLIPNYIQSKYRFGCLMNRR
jgi:cyclopropane fatty-acyl-phospholipid synthase-like methyltransferase